MIINKDIVELHIQSVAEYGFRYQISLRVTSYNMQVIIFKILIKVYPYLPNPSARAGYDTRSIFKRSLTGLNSEFSFS